MTGSSNRIYCAVFGCMNSSLTHPEITFFKLPGNSERQDYKITLLTIICVFLIDKFLLFPAKRCLDK